jgi:hypothetical protein
MMRHAAILLLVLAAAACTGPVRSYGVYESKAANTAEQIASSVATAELTTQAAVDGKSFGRTTAQALAETADDAGSVQGVFDAIQPPDRRSDRLRSELDDLLDEAVSTLEDLRTAARRGDVAGLRLAGAPLSGLSRKLDDFAEAHR